MGTILINENVSHDGVIQDRLVTRASESADGSA
jgi:hypothetical protein